MIVTLNPTDPSSLVIWQQIIWRLCIREFDDTVFLYFQVIDLKTQLTYFKNVKKVLRQKLGDEETTTLLAKAVYLINIGGNDYFAENSSLYTHEKYVSMVVGNLTTVIKVRIKFTWLWKQPIISFQLIYTMHKDKRNDTCIIILWQLSLSYSRYILTLSHPFSLFIVFDQKEETKRRLSWKLYQMIVQISLL